MAAAAMSAWGRQVFRRARSLSTRPSLARECSTTVGACNMENSTISGNKATVLGGGIFNDQSMNMENSTISGNKANSLGWRHLQ